MEQLEVRGDRKQAVILGMHASGQPYVWEGERCIVELRPDEGPPLDSYGLRNLVRAMRERGWSAGGP